MRPVPDAMAQYVDHAALADLALQPSQELLSDRAIVVDVECLGQMGLRGRKEGAELSNVGCPRAVVVGGISE